MWISNTAIAILSLLCITPQTSAIFLTVLAGWTVKKWPSQIGPGFESRRWWQKGHRSILKPCFCSIGKGSFINYFRVSSFGIFWPFTYPCKLQNIRVLLHKVILPNYLPKPLPLRNFEGMTPNPLVTQKIWEMQKRE